MQETLSLILRGEALLIMHVYFEALSYFTAAQERINNHDIDSPYLAARLLRNIGITHMNTGQPTLACVNYDEAIRILTLLEHQTEHSQNLLAQARQEHYEFCEGVSMMDNHFDNLSQEKIISLVDTTIAVCTTQPEERQFWQNNLIEEQHQTDNPETRAFYDALLAIIRQELIEIDRANRYFPHVDYIIKKIMTFTGGEDTDDTPQQQPATVYSHSVEHTDVLPDEQSPVDVCYQTFITDLTGSATQREAWIEELGSKQDFAAQSNTAADLYTSLLAVMQRGTVPELAPEHPFFDMITKTQDDIRWTNDVMLQSLKVLTNDIDARDQGDTDAATRIENWLVALRRMQVQEEHLKRIDRVEFLARIDLLIDENSFQPLPEQHRYAPILVYIGERVRAFRGGQKVDVTDITEKTIDALISPGRVKKIKWKKTLQAMLNAMGARHSNTTHKGTGYQKKRPMEDFLAAIIAFMNDEPVRNMWGNPYEMTLDYIRNAVKEAAIQAKVEEFITTDDSRRFILVNETLVLSDAFNRQLADWIEEAADDDLSARARYLLTILAMYRSTRLLNLDQTFIGSFWQMLEAMFESSDQHHEVFFDLLIQRQFPNEFEQAMLVIYQQHGEDMFRQLVQDQDYTAEFIDDLVRFIKSVLAS